MAGKNALLIFPLREWKQCTFSTRLINGSPPETKSITKNSHFLFLSERKVGERQENNFLKCIISITLFSQKKKGKQ